MVQEDRPHERTADVMSYDGLPIPTGASESIWLHDVKGDPLLDYQNEPWEETADIVIIGSGITGATIAHTLLLHPSCPKRVVMLEARQVCGGATGRNAGHCRPDINRGFGRFAALHGTEQAVKIMHNEQATFEAAMAYIKDHEVDCDLWMGDTLDVYMQDEARAACEANNAAFAAAGGNMSRVRVIKDPEEVERVSGVKGAKYVEAHQAATLHPWKLVAHMLRSCIRHGLQLYTHTPVTAVEPSPPGATPALAPSAQEWMVRTARGSIRTPVVIHATNGYARSLLPEVHSVIVPQPHLCNRVIPSFSALPSNTADPKQSLSIVDHPVGYSVNPRPDGSVLFGARGHGYEQWTDHLAKDHTRATSDACAAFPLYRQGLSRYAEDRLGIVADEKEGSPMTWTGVQGRSADQIPWIGQVPGKAGQWMCCGHHGHGMARIFTCGPAVAKMILGATWQETGLPECFEITSERITRNVPKLNGH